MYQASLKDLESVLAIARRGSFRAAAIDLDMSTTALSNAIAKLEADLGVRLFNRTTRSLSLTDAGRIFVEQVGPSLQEIKSALEAVRSQHATPSGTLRINAFSAAAQEILSPLVLEFLRRYPQVHVDLVTEGRLVDVVGEGFDLGVRVAGLVPTDMIALPLGRRRQNVVVGSPSYLAARGRPLVPVDLLDHRCIRVRLPNGSLFRWAFENGSEGVQVDVKGPITLDEAGLVRSSVLEGVGLGYLFERDVRADIEAGRLVRVLGDWMPPAAELCLYYPGRRNQSAALAAFIVMAREIKAQAGTASGYSAS
jgi:DNA-binding transcriptional LysR family regulator